MRGGKTLAVENNQTDALRAVAVEVKTANARTDICFADGRRGAARTIPEASLSIAGEFAFYSTDAGGLRQATLVGGTRLAGPHLKLDPTAGQRIAKVLKVDYARKLLWLDQPWPARSSASCFEIGLPGHMTTYTAREIRPEGSASLVAVNHGADYYRSPIEAVDDKAGLVRCVLPLTMGERPGIDRHWVASDDQQRTFWRADVVGRGLFKLAGPPIRKETFAPEGVLRLWEYGVGDSVRQSTMVALRRTGEATYELLADVDLAVSLKGRSVQISEDGQSWHDAGEKQGDGWIVLALKAADAPRSLKVTP